MKKIVFALLVLLLMAACGGQKTQGSDVVVGDSATTDSVVVPGDEKHNTEYIRQRIDAVYGCYKNPKYNETGMRVMKSRGNLDSLYCSQRYKELLDQALELTDEDEILLDYDHWTNSQDDNDFTYEIGQVEIKTDSTAVVQVNAKNFGNEYTIKLGLLFERNDWYVDDFLSPDGKDGEKAYFQNFIRDRIRTKAEELSLNHYAE